MKPLSFGDFDRHLCEDAKPSEYFSALIGAGSFPREYPFDMLLKLKDVPQSPVYHPEGSVFKHTMMVVDNAARIRGFSKSPRSLMWAAMLHDLGKIPATKVRKGRITAYDHDVEGEKLARDFLRACVKDTALTEEVCALVRWHMQALYVEKNLPFADTGKMKTQADAREVALLSLCDRLGRGGLDRKGAENEIRGIGYFVEKCGVDINDIDAAADRLTADGIIE